MSPPEAVPLLYAVQQQALGSIQWSIVASSLKETSYTVGSLCKGVRYAFRVLSSTGKALSKPSAATDLVQLLDRGTGPPPAHTFPWFVFILPVGYVGNTARRGPAVGVTLIYMGYPSSTELLAFYLCKY